MRTSERTWVEQAVSDGHFEVWLHSVNGPVLVFHFEPDGKDSAKFAERLVEQLQKLAGQVDATHPYVKVQIEVLERKLVERT